MWWGGRRKTPARRIRGGSGGPNLLRRWIKQSVEVGSSFQCDLYVFLALGVLSYHTAGGVTCGKLLLQVNIVTGDNTQSRVKISGDSSLSKAIVASDNTLNRAKISGDSSRKKNKVSGDSCPSKANVSGDSSPGNTNVAGNAAHQRGCPRWPPAPQS